jgi:uncharacterized protein YkwD
VSRGRTAHLVAGLVSASLVALLTVIPAPRASALSAAGSRALALINQSRSSAGLAPLALDSGLSSIAQAHAQNMASQGRLFHNNSFASKAQPWSAWGENVGSGADADTIHRGLMGSSSHRANILSRTFNLVGIGAVQASGKLWVVQDFVARDGVAAPRPAPAPKRVAVPAPPPPPPPQEEIAPWLPAIEYFVPDPQPFCRLVCLTEP